MTDINKSVAELLNRPLTAEEITGLNNFKGRYDIDDSDPLAIVLALVGANTVLMNSMPNLLQQKAADTIESHRSSLREQSTVIAKELIETLSRNIVSAAANSKILAIWFCCGFVFGSFLTLLITHWLRK